MEYVVNPFIPDLHNHRFLELIHSCKKIYNKNFTQQLHYIRLFALHCLSLTRFI